MPATQHTIHGNTAIVETPTGYLELTPYADTIVRVRYALNHEFSTKPSLMIQQSPAASVAIELRETADHLFFSTSKLSIRINRRTGAFTYLDSSGEILTKEPDRGGKLSYRLMLSNRYLMKTLRRKYGRTPMVSIPTQLLPGRSLTARPSIQNWNSNGCRARHCMGLALTKKA